MDGCSVLFAATVAQNKLSKLCRLLPRIFLRIDLHKENERSYGKFPFITNKYKTRIADGRLWTMDWHCSVRTHNKILNNEAQNEDE